MQIDRDSLRSFMEERVPFNAFLGLKISECDAQRAVVRLPYRESLIGDIYRPALHGGAVAALIDVAAGVAAFSRSTRDDRISTVDLRIDYLRPAPKQDLIATAEVRRMGSRVAVVNVIVVPDGDREPVAEGRAVYSVYRNLGPLQRANGDLKLPDDGGE